jgi:hypothetical protein
MNDTEVLLQHQLDCARPDVHATHGVTKVLLHCRTCHAEVWVPKGQLR